MNEQLITERCYERVKNLYVEREFLLYEFPCRILEGVSVAGVEYRAFHFRLMDVVLPENIEFEYCC
jgi:hypothetical protein